MLGRQHARVAELALRERRARVRVMTARQTLRGATIGFLCKPTSLLVPFAAGVVGSAIALPRTSTSRRRSRERVVNDTDVRRGAVPARSSIPWTSLLKTATTLWRMSEPLRESFLAARVGEERQPAEPAAAPERYPGYVDPPEHADPPDAADATRQPAPQPAPPA